MRARLAFAAVTLFLLIAYATGDEIRVRKFKRPKKIHRPVEDDVDIINNVVPDSGDPRIIADNAGVLPEKSSVQTDSEDDSDEQIIDPCIKVHCGAGRVCELDGSGEPRCVCIPSCPVETDSRRKVCSNHNETWPSDCAVYQQRCWCSTGDARCRGEDFKHVHIEYYGECRDMPECKQDEMADFPRRMRDWLFNIMRDLADREELTPHFLKMEREAETNMTRRWMNAAIWKFCDLDGQPPDRYISRHELFPIRAPLMSLEHCIAPFLNLCDTDNNHRITLKEWAKCLELEEDEIEDKCEELADDEDDEE